MVSFPDMSVQLRLAEETLFVQRLHVFLRAGVPLLAALGLMHKSRNTSSRWRSATFAMSSLLAEGKSFAVAVQVSGVSDDPWVHGLLEAGEVSGSLTEHVAFWQEHVRGRQQARRQAATTFLYPALVGSLICVQLALLFWFILPRLLPLFQQLHYQLPLATRMLLGAYNQLRLFWGLYVAGALLAAWGCIRVMHVPAVRSVAVGLIRRLPLVGDWYQYRHMLMVSRSLGILLRSGMPLLPALAYTGDVVTAPEYKRLVVSMAAAVEAGRPLAAAFAASPVPVPAEFSDLLDVGEQTGQLADVCMQATVALQAQLHICQQRMAALVEPLLLIGIAGAVGFIAVAIILPLYGVTQSIH